ncbi:MAG TPA: hypothetical protein VGJ94_18410 [Syntrophorhabdaceae bacterium]
MSRKRHRIIAVLAAWALIVAVATMISLNCAQNISKGCVFSQKVKLSVGLRDSLTSTHNADMAALPPSAPAVHEQLLILSAETIDTFRFIAAQPQETPPLRC